MNFQNIAGFTDKQVLFYSSSSISIFTPEPGRAVSVGKNEKSSICQLENDFSAKLDENLLTPFKTFKELRLILLLP